MARALMSIKVALAIVALCITASIASPSDSKDSKDSKKRHKWERLGLWGKRSANAPLVGVEHEVLLSSHQLPAVGVYEADSEEQHEGARVDKRRQAAKSGDWSRLGLFGRK